MSLPHQPIYHPPLSFPPHNAPRVWLIHPGHTGLVLSLSRQLLEHGDHIALAISKTTLTRDTSSPQGGEFGEFTREMQTKMGSSWRERLRILDVGGSEGTVSAARAQSLVSSAIGAFGRIDILLCGPAASTLVAGVADLCGHQNTYLTNGLVRGYFESSFFSVLNVVRAMIPVMRTQGVGHVITVSGTSGIPGLGVYGAAGAALESWSEALGLEIAGYGIRVSSVVVGGEVGVFCGSVTELGGRDGKGSFDGILSRLKQEKAEDGVNFDASSAANIRKYSSPLSAAHREKLFMEAVHALVAIGGHENPPIRHVIGADGVADVKEKVKMMEEELDEFEECSIGVDRIKPEATRVREEKEGKEEDIEGTL